MPSTSDARRPASRIALRMASTAIARVVRPECREYSVSPTPTMQYLSRSELVATWGLPGPARREPGGGDATTSSGPRSGRGRAASALAVELREELAGVRAGGLSDGFRRAFGDDLTTLIAALRAEVDDPVGRLDDVEMVLDDEHGVARVHEPVQHPHELFHVVEVKAGRRLVEDVEHVGGGARAQLGSDLEALGLAAGERGRRLAEPKIAEADVAEDAEPPGQRAVGGEEVHRVVHGHREHVGDRAASVLHAEHVGPVAPALALLAGD